MGVGARTPMAFFQSFPELVVEQGPEIFTPTLYGFKIFGQKGSHYEITYDDYGKAQNEERISKIMQDKRTDAYDERSDVEGDISDVDEDM